MPSFTILQPIYMSVIFKKLLLKKETPFLSKIVHFRHKIAWILEKKTHSQKPQNTCLIIYHKEVPPAVWAKSRTRTPDHLLVSTKIMSFECRLTLKIGRNRGINMAVKNLKKAYRLCSKLIYEVFEVAGQDFDIRLPKFKVADAIWRLKIWKQLRNF